MYRLKYQHTHDIDWFCRINDIPVHIASNGGHIPFDSYSIDQLVSLQHQVANLPSQYKCNVNTGYLSEFLVAGDFYSGLDELLADDFASILPEGFEVTDDIQGLSRMMLVYGWSFIDMAKKGFFSFDRGHSENGVDYYHLVAWPQERMAAPMSQDIIVLLKEYRSCCFPPFHEDYASNLPSYMRFKWQQSFRFI